MANEHQTTEAAWCSTPGCPRTTTGCPRCGTGAYAPAQQPTAPRMIEVPTHRLEPELFTPTMHLRWRVPPYTITQPRVLEQAWRGTKGTVEWRPVPVEVVP